MNQIVCLSSANWHPYPSRKQQVMSRLQDCEILYFDPPVTYLGPLKDKTLKPRLKAHLALPERVKKNITVYALPPVLPFGSRFRWINRLNQRRQARFILQKMRAHGFDAPILWSYLPQHCDLLPRLPHGAAVYDCVDRHSGYPGQIDPGVVDRMERELAAACDAVFSTAAGLHDTLVRVNPGAAMIPNGVDYALFARAQDKSQPPPEELADVAGPVVGFVGMLQECIDRELLTALAKAHPEYTLVFIGRVLPGVDVSALEALPNVRLLGLRPQRELPRYIARFDACVNPFRAGSLSRDVSPLKFYEYLATGCPVVTTPQPEQVLEFADAVYIAHDAPGFIAQVERAVREPETPEDAPRREKRLAYAQNCTWDARVEQIEDKLRALGIFS